jgi:hypothetical protein
MQTQNLSLNEFQEQLLAIPEAFDVFLGGGRGGGKSYGLAYLILRHCEQYGMKARVLYVRKTYKGLADFELVLQELFGTIYGKAARYQSQEHVWRLPNGAYVELGQIESFADYQKYQGRSFTLLLTDEAGQYNDPQLLDILRSNLRGGAGIPIRTIIAANPGGAGHHWLASPYVFNAAPWTPFKESKSKREWLYAPSTLAGNHFIDREQYQEQLGAACADDPELLRAWTEGDWTVVRGAYFAAAISEERNAIDPWEAIPEGWDTHLAHDFGSAAPSVTYICATSPGAEVNNRWYPRGSIVLVDELATNRKGNLNKGLYWTVDVLAEAIRRDLCSPWGVEPFGVADDAIFAKTGASAGSIADEFAKAGVHFQPAKKADRITGWQMMKRLLANAGRPDVPGLYVSRLCGYWWATVPTLARDEKRVEDLDTTGPDHAADACRYGLLVSKFVSGNIDVKWTY